MTIQQSLQSGINGLKAHWKEDLQAGFSISLIALPLCLGIAIASNFPPIAGLFAAIVGGLLVSRINGSHVTITGPAAGLIVVNLAAVESLGAGDNAAGYRYALAAIFVAGIMIFLFGKLKAGKLGDFFPTSVVHGMLAAIGVIIMVKQFYVAVGVKAHGHELYEAIEEIPAALAHANPEIAMIAVVALAILILHPMVKSKFIKLVPAPLWVLLATMPLAYYYQFEVEHEYIFAGEHFKLGPQFMVHLPDNILNGVVMPDFGKVMTSAFWISVVTIALVTAIESLLSAVAVDSLDLQKRKSELNKDLSGLGIGSSASAFIGGLPMISEIVRSSANVSAGAKTQWSNFFHAGFLLLFLLVARPLIEHIPLAALAAMLVFTGYRLASPKEFKHVYATGKTELLVFMVTLIVVLATDLLIGIAVGIGVNMLVNVLKGTSVGNLFKANIKERVEGETVTLSLEGSFTFSNYLGLKKYLLKHEEVKTLNLDLSAVTMMDHSVVHHLHGIERDRKFAGKSLNMLNGSHLKPVSLDPLAERRANVKVTLSAPSHRDDQLKEFATQNDWQYEPVATNGSSQWKSFHTFAGKWIEKQSHVLTRKSDSYGYVVADIELQSGAEVSERTTTFTALRLDPAKGFPLPSFKLEKEQMIDRIMEAAGWNDIDFSNHPDFSDYYLLKGEPESAVRVFFNEALLAFLEKNQGFSVESNGNSLLFYKPGIVLSPEEIKNLVNFSNEFIQCVKKTSSV